MIAPAAAAAILASAAAGRNEPPVVTEQPTRGPSAVAFSRDGATAYVTLQDTGEFAVVDAVTGIVTTTVPTSGKQPTGIAISPDGMLIVIANNYSDSVDLIETSTRAVRSTVRTAGGPFDVVCDSAGHAFVSLSRLDKVVRIDLQTGKVSGEAAVGRNPRALALTGNGGTLVCADMTGGSLELIDTATLSVTSRIPVGAINLRGLEISADGSHAYVTAQQPHNDMPTDNPLSMWSNELRVIRLSGGAQPVEKVYDLDTPERGAADPGGVALDADSALVSLGGTHEVARVPIAGGVSSMPRTIVGANPTAIVARPKSDEFWTVNHLSNSIAVLDGAGAVRRVIRFAPPALPDIRLHGRFMFASANLTRGMRFSCNTCHPDGNTEGLAWQFAHVHDGIDRRNSRNLRGGLLLTGPYGWSGRSVDFEEFVNDEVQHLLHGPYLTHSEVHAFWDFVNDFDLPPNPNRQADGTLTPAAARGKALFSGDARCSRCHGGPLYGGGVKKQWIGTTPEGVAVDVPHLVGVYDSAPYLHDCRAQTLEDVFRKWNERKLHGEADKLTAAQFADLMEFVREL